MVNLALIRERGGNEDHLKRVLSDKENPKTKPLIDRIRSRLQEGISNNLKNYKLFYALDLAWNTPLRQASYTLLQSLISKQADTEDVKSALNEWGLAHLITQDGTTKTVNAPVFHQIFVPLVRAYLTIRWAKIVNDRRAYPLLKYEPHRQTKKNRVMCEVITDRIQLISQQYDYFGVIKQAVFQMLHYGYCLQFPMESWHSEQQWETEDKEVYVREGIRYHMPHPTRCFFDVAHRLSTINSDSGVTYLGYWTIRPYREVKNTPGYWNLDKISVGAKDWLGIAPNFFATVGQACALRTATSSNLANVGLLDREKEIGYYSSDLDDYGVTLTEYRERLVPKDYGLFDYDKPVWMRFVIAGDDTVIFAEPLPYAPAIYYGYDSNENQSLNSSLSLEILPTQDMVGNLLSQYILSVKQNLANLNLLNQDILGGSDDKGHDILTRLKNLGDKFFSSLNFEWYSGRKVRVQQANIEEVAHSVRFTPLPVDGIIAGIRQLLDLLERALVISAQEVAAAASHEQTAEEVRVISGSTSTRLTFTETSVDQAIYAMKNQLYQGLMAYGEPEFYAQIATPVKESDIRDYGFTVEEKWDQQTRRAVVKAKKTAVALEAFSSIRDGEDRINNTALASAMSQVLGVIVSNERLLDTLGDEQVVQLLNFINQYLGLPKDFVLRSTGQGGATAMKTQLVEVIKRLQTQVQQQVVEGVKPVADAVAVIEQAVEGVAGNLQGLAEQTQVNSQQLADQAQLLAKLSEVVQASNGIPPADPAFLAQGPGAPPMAEPIGLPAF